MNAELTPLTDSSRRALLLGGAGALAMGVAGCGGAASANDRRLVFTTLGDAMAELQRLSRAQALPPATAFSWPQTLVHCAQSIEYSLAGFPILKPAIFQHTLGAAAFQVFTWRGRMSHDLAEPIPGAPSLQAVEPVDLDSALARLHQAVNDFQRSSGPLQPHFAYGALDKAAYERAHAMHLAQHFSAFDQNRA